MTDDARKTGQSCAQNDKGDNSDHFYFHPLAVANIYYYYIYKSSSPQMRIETRARRMSASCWRIIASSL